MFATSFLAMGADECGWEQALEMQLDLQVAANKRLNKMAWCYLTIMLEGSALDEMGMILDKNACEVWQHLKGAYEPKGRKANDYQKMKFMQCQLDPSKVVNEFLQNKVRDADADGDADEEDSLRSDSRDGAQSEQSNKGKRQNSFQCHQEKDQHQQYEMEKVLVKISDQMVVPNGIMGNGKQQTIMEESMSENVRLQSEEKQIEQQEGRHGKR